MAAITWADVLAIPAPELVSVSNAAQTAILAYVNDALNVEKFGGEGTPLLTRARALLAAHSAALAMLAAEGPLIGETEGGLSRQWASQWANRTHGQTAYGVLYDQLISTTISRVGFAT